MALVLLRVLSAVAVVLGLASFEARADWRDDYKPFRVGVVTPPNSLYGVNVMEPFRLYLQERLRVPVVVVPQETLDDLIEAQISGDIHYGLHSATSYATALVRCDCVEAIGAPVAGDGALGYYSLIVARTEDGLQSIADARGRSIVFGPEDSVSGRLVPVMALAREGVVPEEFFLRVETAEGPRDAVASLVNGDVDLAVAWASMTGSRMHGYDFGVLHGMVRDGELDMADVNVIWQSPLIPFGPHAVSSDIPPELRDLLREALSKMAEASPAALLAVDRNGFGGGGFTHPDGSLYSVVTELVTAPGSE